jgi:hypothetical protein
LRRNNAKYHQNWMSSELVEILNLHLSLLFDKGNICSNQFDI